MGDYTFKVFEAARLAEDVMRDTLTRFEEATQSVVQSIKDSLETFKSSTSSIIPADVQNKINDKVVSVKKDTVELLEKAIKVSLSKMRECSTEAVFSLNMADETIYFIMETNVSCQERDNEFDQNLQDWLNNTLDDIYNELKKYICVPTTAVLTMTRDLAAQFCQIETEYKRFTQKIISDIEDKFPDGKDKLLADLEVNANKFIEKSKTDMDSLIAKTILVLGTAQTDLEAQCNEAKLRAQRAIDSRYP